MALGRYSRLDNKRSSSSYWSTVIVVMFKNKNDIKEQDVKEQSGLKDQVSESNEGNARQFEDNPGDLPEDATKRRQSRSLLKMPGKKMEIKELETWIPRQKI
ncbi:hypothetical protein K1719_020717 [Acacia pycnantha]|nr:hypothetical protein K1719_020717 [Acacia pycnantha]